MVIKFVRFNFFSTESFMRKYFKTQVKIVFQFFYIFQTGLPHTQGIQGNSGNVDLFFKLREVLFFSKNFREVLRLEKSQANFC